MIRQRCPTEPELAGHRALRRDRDSYDVGGAGGGAGNTDFDGWFAHGGQVWRLAGPIAPPGSSASGGSSLHVVQPVVTLTFDNGPTAGVTERVLDILKSRDTPATFFVVGSQLIDPAGREASHRAVTEGHRLGGHTWSHTIPFGQADDQTVDSELERTGEAVGAIGGDPLLFRPFGLGGTTDERLMSRHGADRLRAGGYTCVLWNSVPGDWCDADGWVDQAVDDVTSHPWTVVVLHDLPVGAADRLDEFLDQLDALGVEFSQDTPDDCTPIRAGAPTASFAELGVGDP